MDATIRTDHIHTECFRRFLRVRRTMVGLTQAQLGERVGLSRERITQYESGDFDRLPPFDVALRMADVLGVSIEDMVDAAGLCLTDFSLFACYASPEGLPADIFTASEQERHT